MNVCPVISVVLAAALSGAAIAAPKPTLDEVLARRIGGDRSGACLAAAVIEKDTVVRSFACADGTEKPRIGPDSAFEIGSISKTMTAALLAELIQEGKGSLDDPLAEWLPEGSTVPDFDGQPILLRHVVTHTSGLPVLPAGMEQANPADPYARMDSRQLLAALAGTRLQAAPGSRFEYSNFASLLLSLAVANRAGRDLETLLRERLFGPLEMETAYVKDKPSKVRAATGHAQSGQAVPAWTFATNAAGAGGVRATLDDMVHYVQGQLGWRGGAIQPALQLTHEKLSDSPAVAMNWMLVPVAGRTVYAHEGGTGGFSSLAAFDPERGRGVVVLSDTSVTALGGLGDLGLHLLDDAVPLGTPRQVATPPAELLEGLAGEYTLQGGLGMTLSARGGKLYVQATGQPEFELGHDSAGDFYPLAFDALLTPQKNPDGRYSFAWHQGGGVMAAQRVQAAAGPAPSTVELEDYAGVYPLMPGFDLHVRARDGALHAQATGQGEFPLQGSGRDRFEAPAFGIEIRFSRDAAGRVTALDLHQAGGVLHGERQAVAGGAR